MMSVFIKSFTWLCLLLVSSTVATLDKLSSFRAFTLSDAILPSPTTNIDAVYDASFDPKSIYMTGGTECRTCIWKYNIHDDTIALYDTLRNTTGGVTSGSDRSSVFINGAMYWLSQNGDLLKYDILSKKDSIIHSFTTVFDGCLTKHPNNGQLYIQGAKAASADPMDAATQFFIYNLDSNAAGSNVAVAVGPSLNHGRSHPSCVISEYYSNNPYLYVFAGESSFIERLKINEDIKTNKWQVLTTKFDEYNVGDKSTFRFDSHISYFGIFSFKEYIFIVNGYDGGNGGENEMFIFNCDSLTIDYFGEYAISVWSTAPIVAQNRLYNFGGMMKQGDSDEAISAIYYSDEYFDEANGNNNNQSLKLFTTTTGTQTNKIKDHTGGNNNNNNNNNGGDSNDTSVNVFALIIVIFFVCCLAYASIFCNRDFINTKRHQISKITSIKNLRRRSKITAIDGKQKGKGKGKGKGKDRNLKAKELKEVSELSELSLLTKSKSDDADSATSGIDTSDVDDVANRKEKTPLVSVDTKNV